MIPIGYQYTARVSQRIELIYIIPVWYITARVSQRIIS